jgi:hypothetical protein
MGPIGLRAVRVFICFLLGVNAALPLCPATAEQDELCKFLAPGGTLKERLLFRDVQEGFAGVSGEVWTIEPSGRISIARFLNEKTGAPDWERNLTPAELKSLAQTMATSRFLEWPASFGRDAKVNAHRLTLAFGEKKSTLVLQAGEVLTPEAAPPAGDSQAVVWGNFISVVQAIHALAKDRKPV